MGVIAEEIGLADGEERQKLLQFLPVVAVVGQVVEVLAIGTLFSSAAIRAASASLQDLQVVALEMEAAMGDQIIVKELIVVAGKRLDAERLRSFLSSPRNRLEVLTQPCQHPQASSENRRRSGARYSRSA